jgi:hypothetical protein
MMLEETAPKSETHLKGCRIFANLTGYLAIGILPGLSGYPGKLQLPAANRS